MYAMCTPCTVNVNTTAHHHSLYMQDEDIKVIFPSMLQPFIFIKRGAEVYSNIKDQGNTLNHSQI